MQLRDEVNILSISTVDAWLVSAQLLY